MINFSIFSVFRCFSFVLLFLLLLSCTLYQVVSVVQESEHEKRIEPLSHLCHAPVTSLSRTCHDILPAKIHSPPRVPLSFCVRARLLIEVNWIIFIHSPATEPIIVCAWLFGLLFEGEIWKKISVNTLEYTNTHGLKATKWGRQTISSPLTKWHSVYLVSEEPKLM